MKFSQHFDRSLESMANKLWQNVLSASRIVGICSNLVGYWSVELFAKRSTIPFTTFPELSTATKPLKELRRLIMALEIGEDGTVDSFQAFLLFLPTLTNFVFRRSKAAKLGKQLCDYFVFGDNLFGMPLANNDWNRKIMAENYFCTFRNHCSVDTFRYVTIRLSLTCRKIRKRGKRGEENCFVFILSFDSNPCPIFTFADLIRFAMFFSCMTIR